MADLDSLAARTPSELYEKMESNGQPYMIVYQKEVSMILADNKEFQKIKIMCKQLTAGQDKQQDCIKSMLKLQQRNASIRYLKIQL